MAELLTVVLATGNEGKLAELRALMADLPVQLVSLKELAGDRVSVVEDGDTFESNATSKARQVCAATGMVALADDSGLEVESLGGRPGVRSRRFAHDRATDAENNAALLREMEDLDDDVRGARFRCVLALACPWIEHVELAEGRCEGSIARTPRGSGGFGYDPLFVVDGQDGRAMAELAEDEKNRISHRARAVRALHPLLERLLASLLDEAERIAG
jgi:XTP/dITP diphosphohydrolase